MVVGGGAVARRAGMLVANRLAAVPVAVAIIAGIVAFKLAEGDESGDENDPTSNDGGAMKKDKKQSGDKKKGH